MQEKNQEAINNFAAFQGAIPGQSLTNDPDQKYPWEQPPRITNQQEALDYMTSEILEEENLFPIMRAVSKGVPIGDIVSLMLQQAFQAGLINPDLMLLLLEPLHFVLMAIAEKSGVGYVLYEGENEEEEYEFNIEEEDDQDSFKKRGKSLKDRANQVGISISREEVQLPETIEEKIEEAESIEEVGESLLAQPEQNITENKSLLERRIEE